MDYQEIINDERDKLLEIEGVIDVAQGEDESGPHIIVFVDDELNSGKIRQEIDMLSLLSGCRYVVQEELSIGPG